MAESIGEFARTHADRFREARVLVRNEFRALDAHDQYFNAFSRLLKLDPLERVTMLGTDQRDLFIPVVRAAIAEGLPRPGAVLDVGCGDGKTFALFADALPEGSEIDAFDPNPEYVEQYRSLIGADPRLTLRLCAAAGFDDQELELAERYDLIAAIHVIYFFEDLEAAVVRIFERLAPGGTAFIVFADELQAYTGVVLRGWLDRIGDHPGRVVHEALCRRRLELFAELEAVLGAEAEVRIERQPSRLYGHCLADVLALANLTGLAAYEELAKFDVAADILEHAPETVGFRIETAPGPRQGMFSVAQPQLVAVIRKRAA